MVESTDPSLRRLSFVVERVMAASPGEIFDAWVNHFDTWFASSGEISMNAVAGRPYWFDVSTKVSATPTTDVFSVSIGAESSSIPGSREEMAPTAPRPS